MAPDYNVHRTMSFRLMYIEESCIERHGPLLSTCDHIQPPLKLRIWYITMVCFIWKILKEFKGKGSQSFKPWCLTYLETLQLGNLTTWKPYNLETLAV